VYLVLKRSLGGTCPKLSTLQEKVRGCQVKENGYKKTNGRKERRAPGEVMNGKRKCPKGAVASDCKAHLKSKGHFLGWEGGWSRVERDHGGAIFH